MEMFNKMSKQEKELFAVKHMNCLHRFVPAILIEKLKECDCEDCDIECEFRSKDIYYLTFRKLFGEESYSPIHYGSDSEKSKMMTPIINHVSDEKH